MNNQTDEKMSSVMGREKVQTEDNVKKPFRIKTLEELNQDRSRYKGKVTGTARTSAKPIKSLEELNRVNEKATIRYGRSTDVESEATMSLDDFQYPWEKEDAALKEQPVDDLQMDTTAPNFILQGGVEDEITEEQPKTDYSEPDNSQDNYTFSSNGLNLDYLQSILEESDEAKKKSEERINRGAFFENKQSEMQETNRTSVRPENRPVAKESPVKAAEPLQENSKVGQEADEKREEIEQLKAKIEQLKLEIANAEKEKLTSAPEKPDYADAYSAPKAPVHETISQQKKDIMAEEMSLDEPVILEEKESITLYKVVKEIMTYTICIGIALVLSFILVTFVVQKTEVIGDSMEPSLKHQEQLVIDKISYRFKDPERFDIVVFPHENTSYIKRIIGLPGETVSIEEGYIYIDGQMLYDDTYGTEAITGDHYYRLSEPVVLGEDEYFVMGDNRNNSKDSRDNTVGNIKKEQFVGRIIFRIWPFEELGTVD